jgi:aerobic-type carbon monoxide dehydrogenase small subunit (CoxS/CutS family)
VSEERREIRFRLNSAEIRGAVPVRRSLVDALHQDFGHTGSHVGCEHGVCGACSVVLDGVVVRGCLVLAAQADGAAVETIEGASDSGRLAALQQAFFERAALQCGFCTPGMLLTAAELLARNASPSRAEIRAYLSGNYCRCTGYEAIVDAVATAAQLLADNRT